MTKRRLALCGGVALALALAGAPVALAQTAAQTPAPLTMVAIPAGSFVMGAGPELPREYFNERPAHKVTITKGFRVASREVTLEEYRRFRPDAKVATDNAPYVTGISWNDAVAYAAWLSKKEGKQYRLPTEAEWEYVARLIRDDPARYGSIANMVSGPAEWTADRFGFYSLDSQKDPVGAASGSLRVARGGRISYNPNKPETDVEIDYFRPESRLAFPATFGVFQDAPDAGGFHAIGFRLVEGPAPHGDVTPVTPPLNQVGVRQDLTTAAMGPDPAKPYFRKRVYLSTPYDNAKGDVVDASGWDASFRNHHHSPGITVMPNGDVLIAIYNSYHEYEAGNSIIATRLRHGASEWDDASPFADMIGVNDHAPLLAQDGKTARFIWGSPYAGGEEAGRKHFPFQYMSSTDNGATWSAIEFPKVVGPVGAHNRQPINTAFVDKQGRFVFGSDAGSQADIQAAGNNLSILWAWDKDRKDWHDTGGRTAGRHTTFVETRDGRILGYGGKNSNIDGYMPVVTSTDGGKTWVKTKSPFPALASAQRPVVLRLQSGRLMMIGDSVVTKGNVPPVTDRRGAYVAVSADDGATWKFKQLIGPEPNENPKTAQRLGGGTVGYVAAAQGPDGVIHVVASATHPMVTLSFNEAWLDLPEGPVPSQEEMYRPAETSVGEVRTFEERYPDGKLRGRWSGGRANNGAFMFDGPQQWFYADGKPMWQVEYRVGKKTGVEKFFDVEGHLISQHDYAPDGLVTWTRWWPNGQMRALSHWRGMSAEGEAKTWSPEGKPITSVTFHNGELPGQTGATGQ